MCLFEQVSPGIIVTRRSKEEAGDIAVEAAGICRGLSLPLPILRSFLLSPFTTARRVGAEEEAYFIASAIKWWEGQ